jgi:hypothetical protein
MDRQSDGEKTKAEAKKDLMSLLKSKDLSPEEHKKILAIATSIGRTAGASTQEPAGTRIGKAAFILMALIAVALVIVAWLSLREIQKSLERAGPRAAGGSASPSSPSKDSRGPRGPGR